MAQTTATRIYRPLHELKYAYESHSKPTTVQVEVSTKLPTIQSKSRRHNEHATETLRYTNTVKETLKMKLECGHIYDQISLIDRHMEEENAKYEEARSKHESFATAFHQFLSRQYARVTALLAELAAQERASADQRARLEQLQQRATEKSLKIYQVERQWRKYKTSENFLLYLASLLQHDVSTKEYRISEIDPPSDTPSLDELIDNFQRHAQSDRPFERAHFEHVTADRVFAYLSAVRKQNLRLLELKRRHECTREEVEEEQRDIERDFHNQAATITSQIEENKSRIDETAAEIERTKLELGKLEPTERELKRLKAWRLSVEALYKGCFGTGNIVQGSHLQMMKCVEQHCVMLLNKLNTFDPRTLQKVTST